MSDVDDTGESNDTVPKTLREQNSKLTEANKALQEQLTKLLAKDRTRTIAEVLSDKGANPKLAKYADRDLPEGDVDGAAVEKWLEAEGELFGYKPAGADDDEQEDDKTDELVVEQQRRIAAATSTAPQPKTGWTPEKIRQSSAKQLIEAGLLDPK